MDIILEDIDKLIPYARNPRKNQAIDKVAVSIREFGFRQPIVVDKNLTIIAGHTRYEASKKLGLKKVPIHIAKELTPAQVKAYRIADNRVAQDSEWDIGLLNTEFTDLLDVNFDLDLLGFNPKELEDLIVDKPEGLTPDDQVPEIPQDPVAQIGNMWTLGNHKLVCGDSTNPEHIALLFKEQKADMVFTDPPYNVNYGPWYGSDKIGNNRFKPRPIENDNMSDDDFKEFIYSFVVNAKEVVKLGAPYYICYGNKQQINFLTSFDKAGLHHSCNIIWKKHTLVLGRADYHYIHEPIFYGWFEGSKHTFYGGRNKTSVWEFDRPMKSDLHPTMKPVDLIINALLNSSKEEDIIYEPFCGSGSTMIASEKLNRSCYSIEFDPKYCDVIVKRWEDFTGLKAQLVND